MTKHDEQDITDGEVQLPHNAFYDPETGYIAFPIDRITVSFTLAEFKQFYEQIDDIIVVLDQMIVVQKEECPSCGSTFEVTSLIAPEKEDFN